MRQTTNCVVTVAPTEFGANPEAGMDNHFADAATPFAKDTVIREAKTLRDALIGAGVKVIEIDPSALPEPPNAPDGCFPNNWLMFIAGIRPILCPMKDPSRRRERKLWPSIAERLQLQPSDSIDLSEWEREGRYLEGTGSLVLDRVNRVAFAAISERTHPEVASQLAETIGYRLLAFEAHDPEGRPVYHTNVLMSIGTKFAVLCPDVMTAETAGAIRRELSTDRQIIEINWHQLTRYCGNVLELSTPAGAIVAMSRTAYGAFTADQLAAFDGCGARPVVADIPTIEGVAGGSARCMLAEVFS